MYLLFYKEFSNNKFPSIETSNKDWQVEKRIIENKRYLNDLCCKFTGGLQCTDKHCAFL